MKKIISFFSILVVFIIIVLLYSRYIGVTGLNTNEFSIKYSKLSDDFYGLKIVHISDILYGKTTDKKKLETLTEKVNLTKPDIIVITGDILNEYVKLNKSDIDDIISSLSKMNASIGKYVIKGNNDKNDKWNEIISKSSFTDLNNNFDLIYTNKNDSILISGISSNILDKTKITDKLKTTLDAIENSKPNYTILLMHEPDYIDQIDTKKFNLILAGHGLGNSINVPYIRNLFYKKDASKYNQSYYKIKNTDFYISNGIGTSNTSFRLFNHPSFNLYRLIK